MNDINWQEVDQMTDGGIYEPEENEDAAPPREIDRLIKFTPDSPEARAGLEYIKNYFVLYDNREGIERIAQAKCGLKGFEFCSSRFKHPSDAPQFDDGRKVPRRSIIKAWIKCEDWRGTA